MRLEGWTPLAILPIAFFAAFATLAVLTAVRRARKRKSVD